MKFEERIKYELEMADNHFSEEEKLLLLKIAENPNESSIYSVLPKMLDDNDFLESFTRLMSHYPLTPVTNDSDQWELKSGDAEDHLYFSHLRYPNLIKVEKKGDEIFRDCGLPIPDFIQAEKHEKWLYVPEDICKFVNSYIRLFVKPVVFPYYPELRPEKEKVYLDWLFKGDVNCFYFAIWMLENSKKEHIPVKKFFINNRGDGIEEISGSEFMKIKLKMISESSNDPSEMKKNLNSFYGTSIINPKKLENEKGENME